MWEVREITECNSAVVFDLDLVKVLNEQVSVMIENHRSSLCAGKSSDPGTIRGVASLVMNCTSMFTNM